MKTLYDKIAEAIEAEKFLKEGLADKTLMRLNDGTIRPRYCQFCAEVYEMQRLPKIQGWEFNLTDKEFDIVKKTVNRPEWGLFWKNVEEMLAKDGYDVRRQNFLHPWLMHGKQYSCYCDNCGLNSGWYPSQKASMNEFDRIVQQQIEHALTACVTYTGGK